MRTMEVKVYSFEELSEKSKATVIEKNRDINVDYEDWAECLLDEWKAKLARIGFHEAEISYSGFSSQGDGACFDARHYDIPELAAAVYSGKDEGFQRELLTLLAEDFSIKIEKNSFGHHYSHARTRYISLDKGDLGIYEDEINLILSADLEHVPPMIAKYDVPCDDPQGSVSRLSGLVALRLKYAAQPTNLDNLLDLFEKHAEELRERLSNEIYRELEKDYESLVSDESVIETINLNEYEFDESGDMI